MRENSYGISGGKLANGTTAERITPNITAPSTEDAKKWDGWGSALKPAVEPIVLARKPLEKGLSIAQNVLKWGTGAINIDGCRISTSDINGLKKNWDRKKSEQKNAIYEGNWKNIDLNNYAPEGRFPANLILSHHPDCCFNGVKKLTNSEQMEEDWTCVDGCPIKIMDEQSGESKSSDTKRNRNTIGSFGMPNDNTNEYNDKGGASRFFYTAKASKSERNFGLDGFDEKRPDARDSKGMGTFEEKGVQIQKNFHPTVKPLKIIQYLVRLITPPNGKVLDPFNGSGTTGIACSLEGFEYTGIELDTEYCKISEARITAWNEIEEYEQYKKIIENQEEEKLNEKLGVRQTNLFED